MRNAENSKLRATYAALCAVGKVIPPKGIYLEDLIRSLNGLLDEVTLTGLVRELERRRIIYRAPEGPAILERGAEYEEGIERLRLAGDSLRE